MKKRLLFVALLVVFAALTVMLVACNNDPCANGHDFVQDQRVEATCDERGYYTTKCSNCQTPGEKSYFTDSPRAHNAEGERVYNNDETCTQNGTETFVCRYCRQTITQERLGSAAHDWLGKECDRCSQEYVNEGLVFELNDASDGYIVSQPANFVEQDKILNIPAAYKGLPVVEIKQDGFRNNGNGYSAWVEYVYIPSSVKKIGNGAFYMLGDNVNNKASGVIVQLNEGLEVIGESAFEKANVIEISIPATVTELGASAFKSSSLAEIQFEGDDVTTLENYVFYGTNLSQYEIPSSVTTIKGDALARCPRLVSITIPESVTTIELGAFTQESDGILNTIINNSQVEMSNENKSYYFGSSFQNPYFAFRTVDPNVIMTIECENSSSYQESEDVIPFYLSYIHLDGENVLLAAYDNFYTEDPKELTVPQGITLIEGEAFMGLLSAQKLILPDSVKVIRGQTYGVNNGSDRVVELSSYTDVSELSGDYLTGMYTVTLEYRENAKQAMLLATISIHDIWEYLTAENDYTYITNGVKIRITAPDGDLQELGQKVLGGESYPSFVGLSNAGLTIEVSLVEGYEHLTATHLSIKGHNSSGTTTDGVNVLGYYYDDESNQWKEATGVDTGFSPWNDTYTDVELSDAYDLGNGPWKFELDNIETYGYHIVSVSLSAEVLFNADLTQK